MSHKITEAMIQRAVFLHLRTRGVLGVFAFHCANGGYRRPTEARILKSMGVVAGVPDIILIYEGRTYGLELKTLKGCLTSKQHRTIAAMRLAGAECFVTYGLDEALSLLEQLGFLRHDNSYRRHGRENAREHGALEDDRACGKDRGACVSPQG